MIKYEWKDSLNRKIRQDDPVELGISNWTLVRNAIKAGKADEALELMDYELSIVRGLIDSLTMFRDMALTRLAEFDEGAIEQLHRKRYTPWVKDWITKTPGVEESLQRFTEQFRTHLIIDYKVIEEPDRYIMVLAPCGTGGRLRKSGAASEGTKKAYPWSWSKKGVCYYCSHCCMFQEILPIEMRGYPICVTEYADNPKDPCRHLYYKKPELIPDEYFTRIGKTPYRLVKGKK